MNPRTYNSIQPRLSGRASRFHSLLKKALVLSGAIFIGWAANAQSTGNTNTMSSDTTHRMGMHRHWGNHNGSDSLAKRDGFRGHRGGFGPGNGFGGPGGREGWANGPRGHQRGGFGHDGFAHRGWGGERGNGIHYTPEQRRQVASINADYRKKAADLFKNDNLTLRQYKAQLVAFNKEKKAKLEALITPQQKEQLAARKQRASENIQVAEAGHLERLKLRLNLTDDQVAKLKANQESFRSQAKAIRDNDDLLPQQKAEQFKDLMAKNKDSYKSVLTPEQLSKFQEMHRPGGADGGRGGFRSHRPGNDNDDSK